MKDLKILRGGSGKLFDGRKVFGLGDFQEKAKYIVLNAINTESDWDDAREEISYKLDEIMKPLGHKVVVFTYATNDWNGFRVYPTGTLVLDINGGFTVCLAVKRM